MLNMSPRLELVAIMTYFTMPPKVRVPAGESISRASVLESPTRHASHSESCTIRPMCRAFVKYLLSAVTNVQPGTLIATAW